jgi:hypothetical protein
MKSNIILSVLIIACLGFGVACSFSDTPVQVLANKEHRAVIIKSIALSPEYRTQMMDELMSNDSSKVWLLQYLMHHKIIMNDLFDLTAKDSIASRDLMAKTIEMCDGDAEKCRLLMGTLSSYPNIISYTKTSYHLQKPVY